MNYIIGMCKKHRNWIHVLADLGYEPQVIEKQVRTSSGDIVQPNIIATSNKLIHSLVFECKGGITVEQDQLQRYSTLTNENILRWITVFASENFHFDVCISDLEENHRFNAYIAKIFPMITFGNNKVSKTGDFGEEKLNVAFEEPITLEDKIPPLSYYPFSEDDENAYIAPFVIRGLVSIAIKNAKGGPSISEEIEITRDELIKLIFNPVYDALSRKHQGRLKEKIKEVIHLVKVRESMKDTLGIIEKAGGYKVSRPLSRLIKESEKFIAHLETQSSLIDFV